MSHRGSIGRRPRPERRARPVRPHRRVIVMEGVVALWVAAVCVAAIVGLLSPVVGLVVVLGVLVPYLVVLGVQPRSAPTPGPAGGGG